MLFFKLRWVIQNIERNPKPFEPDPGNSGEGIGTYAKHPGSPFVNDKLNKLVRDSMCCLWTIVKLSNENVVKHGFIPLVQIFYAARGKW